MANDVVDLSTPRASPQPPAPTSLAELAASLDSKTASIPSLLNTLLSPHLPPAPLFQTPTTTTSTKPSPTGPLPDLTALDKALADLLTRLSLLSQDTSSALEQSIHDISRSVPRLTYDLQFMRESAGDLQSSLSGVQERVARQTSLDGAQDSTTRRAVNGVGGGGGGGAQGETDEVKTHKALERLAHLDKLKTRMESARDILREAESWSTLEGEMTSLIASQAWTKAGARLHEASRSMVVFQNTPAEYEAKRTLLVSLQNELEGNLSNGLKGAIGRGDVEAVSKFWEVFEMMDREEEFGKFYFGERRMDIVDEWNEAILLDTAAQAPVEGRAGADAAVKMSAFLPRWYATILATLQREKDQVPLIFPPDQAPAMLATFLQTTLDGLSPSLETRLAAVAEYHGADALPEIIKAYRATEELAAGVQGLLDTLAFNTQGGLLSGGPPTSGSAIVVSPNAPSPITPDHKLRRTPSKRMSISTTRRFSRPAAAASSSTSAASEWETSLFEPFLDLQTSYPTLERRYLGHQLKHHPALILSAPSHGGTGRGDDAARLLSERATAMFALADEAVGRCRAFTHGYGASGLLDALNGFIAGFLDVQETLLDRAAASAKQKGKDPASGSGSGAAGLLGKDDELDFEGLDYSMEDWGQFQLGLHLLRTCRDLRERLVAFEAKLSSSLLEFARLIAASSSSSPLPNDSTATTASLTPTTRGAMMLLQQSPLNSSALVTLLNTISSSSSAPSPSLPYLLQPSTEALMGLTTHTQAFLQSTILAPLFSQLQSYPSLSVWAQPDKAARRGELHIPSFSLSPTDTIARVSEGLLNLLRVFEVYAADDALAFSLETIPHVDLDLLSSPSHPSSSPKYQRPSPTSPTSSLKSLPPVPAPSPPQFAPETVLSTWISSLALTLLADLTARILPRIQRLSTHGANQLSSDLGYLSNAVRALDVESEGLERWREASASAAEGEDEWRRVWREKDGQGGSGGDEGGREVLRRVGRMRGWVQ